MQTSKWVPKIIKCQANTLGISEKSYNWKTCNAWYLGSIFVECQIPPSIFCPFRKAIFVQTDSLDRITNWTAITYSWEEVKCEAICTIQAILLFEVYKEVKEGCWEFSNYNKLLEFLDVPFNCVWKQ